jgi:hypothetical protein
MMNPFIYILRNREMKEVLRKFISRKPSLLWCIICFKLHLIE